MSSSDFIFGPYSSRRGEPHSLDDSVRNTGCALEFSTSAEAYNLEIFQIGGVLYKDEFFGSYVVREGQIPFGIACHPYQFKDHLVAGPYVTLSAFLSELYCFYPSARSIKKFLADLGETLCLPTLNETPDRSMSAPLRSEFVAAGYSVESVSAYGRRLLVDFEWTAPAPLDRRGLTVQAGGVDFRPRADKSLGVGKWITLRPHYVEQLIFDDLRELAKGVPLDVFSAVGHDTLLSQFDWTPLALMTAKQARIARIEFVRNHSELVSDPRALAKALKEAGLYSDDTSVSQICRFLPSLLIPES